MSKFNFRLDRKKIFILSALLIIAMLTLICILIFNSSKENNLVYSSDLERAVLEQTKTYERVKPGDSEVKDTQGELCPNIEFDAYFSAEDLDGNGYADQVRGTCIQVGKEDILYISLNVNNGAEFKNGRIIINSNNFYFDTALPKGDSIKENAISSNTKVIMLTDIENTYGGDGQTVSIMGDVRSGDYNSARTTTAAIGNDISKLSNNENSITLTGDYIIEKEDGTKETRKIEKTIKFDVDWYGTTSTMLPMYFGSNSYNYKEQIYDINNIVDEENEEIHLDFKVLTRENNNELNLSKSEITISIPEIEGYAPIRVEAKDADVKYIYDENNPEKIIKAVITKNAKLDETNNLIVENAYTNTYAYSNAFYRYNIFDIKVTYPIDACRETEGNTVQLSIPVEAYYEGYNNPNEIFDENLNPYKSNIAKDTITATFRNPDGYRADFRVTVGEYYGNPWNTYIVAKKNPINVWNGIADNIGNDRYLVRWDVYTGSTGDSSGLVIKEKVDNNGVRTPDQFETSTGQLISMEGISKNVGIYFSNVDSLLGEDGWIKVYDDDTNELITTFTSSNWNKYYSSNPFLYKDTDYYKDKIEHIRIETSATYANRSFYVYNIKDIDTEYIVKNYTKEKFLEFTRIQSSATGYLDSGKTEILTDIHSARYECAISEAKISISDSKLPTSETTNLNFYINTVTDSNKEKWRNGTFLLKLPKEMVSVEIKDIEVNNENVKIVNCGLEQDNDNTFIKIITENINNDPEAYQITINCDVTPDPTALTDTKTIELYASNENCTNYYNGKPDIYNITGHSNEQELVGYSSTGVRFVSTNNMLTSETITDYDDKEGSITYAPQIAGVVKVDRTAKISLKINNNYSGTNSQITILGRTPFEGNKYTDSGVEMNSTFTAAMSSEGIIVPDELKDFVTVYYSENGEATRDADDWQELPTDKTKSYMICFDNNYQLQRGEQFEFYYYVTIPKDVSLNAVSYSHHTVYFCWDTPNGPLPPTKVEPSKVGISPVEKFNLELTKYQTGVNKVVPGAMYSVTEIKISEDNEEVRGSSKTAITDENGKILISNAYIGRVYEIEEVRSPEDYEKNSNIIRIYTYINEENQLIAKEINKDKDITEGIEEKVSGAIKGDIGVDLKERKVSLSVEDETKAKLRIVKTAEEKEDYKPLSNARFIIKGEGLPTAGKSIMTNEVGIAELSGLKIGSTYTIVEDNAPTGYYKFEGEINFEIVNNSGEYEIRIIKDEDRRVDSSDIEVNDYIPTGIINLTNERIPIFKIVKADKRTHQPLGNIRFIVKEKGSSEKGTALVTDENGNASTSSLYLNKVYELTENRQIDGYYIKSQTIYFKIENNNGSYTLVLCNEDGEELNTNGIEYYKDIVNDVYTTATEGVPTLVLGIVNERKPIFKVVKTDSKTGNPLENVRFKLYGKGMAENGSTYQTDENGEFSLSNLNLNEIYELQETSSIEGYYKKTESVKFKITVNNEGKYELKVTEGNEIVDYTDVTETDGLQTLIIGISNEPIEPFLLDITKVEKDNEEVILPGARFKLYREGNEIGEYITGPDGHVVIDRLYQYVEEKSDVFDGWYTLKEVEAPQGYVPINDITFKVQKVGETLKFIEEGDDTRAYKVEDTTIKLTLEDRPTFKLIKVDGEQTVKTPIKDTEFIIYNIDGDEDVEVGKYTTDSNGEFRAELPEGLYKAVEVKTGDDKYELNPQPYYFGIGKSKKNVGLNLQNVNYMMNNYQNTSDGGYIAYTKLWGDFDLGNGKVINCIGGSDFVVIKYDSFGNIEWYNHIYGEDEVYIFSLEESNEMLILKGNFNGNYINVGNDNVVNNKLGEEHFENIIIKYDMNGNIVDTILADIKKQETLDNGYILYGTFEEDKIDLGNGNYIENTNEDVDTGRYYSNGFIAKYNENNELEWKKVITGNGNTRIDNIVEVDNGIFRLEGYYTHSYAYDENNLDLGDGEKISCESYNVEFFAIYKDGKILNKVTIDKDGWNSYIITKDEGILVSESFSGTIILNNGDEISAQMSKDTIFTKYDKLGNIEWSYQVGKREDKQIQTYNYRLQETSDNGYIAIGRDVYWNASTSSNYEFMPIIKFNSEGEEQWREIIDSKADFEFCYVFCENIIKVDKDEGFVLLVSENINSSISNRIIIKLDKDGNIKWRKSLDNTLNVRNIYGLNEKTIICIDKYDENTVDLGNNVQIKEQGTYSIKYNKNGDIEYVVKGYYSIDKYETGTCIEQINIEDEGTIELENSTSIAGPGNYCVKYNKEGNIEYVVKGRNSIYGCEDGTYIEQIDIEDERIIKLENGKEVAGPGTYSIKYNKNRNMEYIVNGYINKYDENGTSVENIYIISEETIELENGKKLTGPGEYIIIYNSDGSIKNIHNSDVLERINTSDGGLIIILMSNQDIILENGEIITCENGNQIYVIVKYDEEGNIEWRKIIESIRLYDIKRTSDNGLIAIGFSISEEPLRFGNRIVLENCQDKLVMIKYDSNGTAEWAEKICDVYDINFEDMEETQNGEFIIKLNLWNEISLEDGTVLAPNNWNSRIALLNYKPIEKSEDNPIVEYAKSINVDEDDSTELVKETADGGYYTVSESKDNKGRSHISKIIKYTSNGEIQLEIPVNIEGYATSIDETSDGGCIVTFNNDNKGYILKYSNNGILQLNKEVDATLNSIVEINDGEYIVGGALKGSTYSDGIIIKYRENDAHNGCEAIWTRNIVGTKSDSINSVSITNDGGFLATGSYSSTEDINLENGIVIPNNDGKLNGMIIKYRNDGTAEWVERTNQSLKSAEETTDGGYIALSGQAKTDSEVYVTFVYRDITQKQGCRKGDTITLPSEFSMKEGYKFLGWSEDISATTPEYEAGVELTIKSNTTLYAIYEELPKTTYVITKEKYINNEKIVTVSNSTKYSGYVGDKIYKEKILNDNPEWKYSTHNVDGYIREFEIDTSDPEKYIILDQDESKNVIILKYKELKKYTVRYKIDGYEHDYEGLREGALTPECDTIPEKPGYIFMGWTPTVNPIVSATDADKNGVITYTATFKDTNSASISEYSVNYNENIMMSSLANENIILSSSHEIHEINNIVKFDKIRNIEWTENIDDSQIVSIKEARDGGYIAGGNTEITSGIIVKLNRGGNEEWKRTIENSEIKDITQIKDTGYIAAGNFTSESVNFENGIKLENQSGTYREINNYVWNEVYEKYDIVFGNEEYYYSDGMVIKLNAEMMIPERQELTVKNYYKRFNITTEVKRVDGVEGGWITGSYETNIPEIVVYGNDSTEDIIMTPEEDYEIIGVTVNGMEYPLDLLTYNEEEKNYIMPLFENVTEDKHVVVTYSYKENRIIINKVDKDTGEPLTGATFKIVPEGYAELDLLDKMTPSEDSEYYFVQSEDGSYKSNNQGQDNTVATSSIEVDLTGYEGAYVLEVDAGISCEPEYFGQVTVDIQRNSGGLGILSADIDVEEISSSRGLPIGGLNRWPRLLMNISGNEEAQEHIYLTGGRKYTVNFVYVRQNRGGVLLPGLPMSIQENSTNETDINSDTFTINSVKIMSGQTYTVETNSNGQAITNIPFGEYTITEIQAPEGYVLNSEPIPLDFRPALDIEDPEEIHTITIPNTRKSKVIVHFYKLEDKEKPREERESLAEDIVLIGDPGEKYGVKTSSLEQNYITYELEHFLEKEENDRIVEYELENEIDTDGIKSYIYASNANGEFLLDENQDVDYYYAEKTTPLVVYHYIENSEKPVPLANGKEAQSERYKGKEGEGYTTKPLSKVKSSAEEDEQILSEEYEFVSSKGEVSGTYGKEEIVVIYYYKKINRNVSIFKYATEKQVNEETGEIETVEVPLAGAQFTIEKVDNTSNTEDNTADDIENSVEILEPEKIHTTDETGRINVDLDCGDYIITEKEAPEGYVKPSGEDAQRLITINENVEAEQVIEVKIENKKPQGKVIVNHYQLNEDGERTTTPVKRKDGETDFVEDPQIGNVGDPYATQKANEDELEFGWKFAEVDGETSGEITIKDKIINYYYKKIDFENETIDIEIVKIWKDNEIQALRRPNKIVFKVTSVEEVSEEMVTSVETISEEIISNNTEAVDNISSETNSTGVKNEELADLDSSATNDSKSSENNATETSEKQESKEETNNGENEVTVTSENANTGTEVSIKEETTGNTSTPEKQEEASDVNKALEESKADTSSIEVKQDETESDVLSTSETEPIKIEEIIGTYTVDVKQEEMTKYTLEGLPKYSTTGKKLKYVVTELSEDGGKLEFYKPDAESATVKEIIDGNGNIKYTATIVNTFTLPSDNVKDIKGIKIWKDNENVRNTRPLSIILELVGRINKTNVNNETETETIISKEQGISAANDWQHIFTGNPIYNENGQEIEYSVDEKEMLELNKYSKSINSNENKSEFTIINSLNVRSSNIIKTGTEKLRAIDGKVNYKINYTAELDASYEDENIIVTVVDKLPYAISEKERNIAGGVYDEDAKTITWTGIYNTKAEEQVVVWNDGSKTPITLSEEKQVKVVTLNKTISFSYLGLTMEDENKTIVNNVSGTIKLAKSEEEVTAQCRTIIEWKQDVIVNKLWIGDTEETRPDSITVELKKASEKVEEVSIEPTEWTYTWTDLPRYDKDGKEINYTVDEIGIEEQTDEYYCEKTEEVKDGNTIVTLTNNKYGSIIVTKVDSRDDSITLSGAEFKLEKMIQDESGEWIVPIEDSEDYCVAEGVTSENGILTFEGLKYGKYKLTETKAPENYRIAEKDIDIIEVNGEDAEHLNVQVTVKNDKKYSLPTTGGMGTNIIRSATALIGIILIILLTNGKKVTLERRARKTKRETITENEFKPVRRKHCK